MSQLIAYTLANNGSIKQQGAKMGSASLSALAAAGSAIVADGGTTILQLSAAINGTAPFILADTENGHQFQGQPSITITGAGAVLSIEWL